MQEEAGCWCTSVEGIEAEVEANNFGVQMLLQLLKLSYKVLSHYDYGGCTSGLRPARSTTSSSAARSFCKRLKHRLNKMLLRVLCV